ACKLKLDDPRGALLDTEFAMRDGDTAKALFRQGQAHMALNDIDAAAVSFSKALELEPNDSGIKKELGAAKKKIFCASRILGPDRMRRKKQLYEFKETKYVHLFNVGYD
ncbi:hypothetical protein CRG98_040329, partial [Punica granatum]